MRVRGPPVIQSALIGVAASPTGKRFAYPLTYHRRFDTMQSGLADGDRMQFDQLKRSDFIMLLGGVVWPIETRAQRPAKLQLSDFFGAAPSSVVQTSTVALGGWINAISAAYDLCRTAKVRRRAPLGRWLIGLHSSRLGALPPASHKRYSRLGWSTWRSLLGSVSRQQCGRIRPGSEISWPAGSIGWSGRIGPIQF
jgi:hypothetical protein